MSTLSVISDINAFIPELSQDIISTCRANSKKNTDMSGLSRRNNVYTLYLDNNT